MKFFVNLCLLTILVSSVHARTWTSTAGTEIEAEFVSADDKSVTIKKSDGHQMTVLLNQLSQEDQEWVVAELKAGSALASLPKDAAALVSERGKVLFEDNFDREDPDGVESLGPDWQTNSQSRAKGDKQCDLVDGTLVMTISPKADHAISCFHTTSEPYQDAVVYLKVKFEEGERFKLAYNDKMFKEVWAGHINGVIFDGKNVILDDEKNGRFSAASTAMKNDPSKKAERTALAEKWLKKFPCKVSGDKWHELVTIHNGENLRVFLDGKEVASHSSPGFAHETKRQFVFAIPRKATVDDLKIWKLDPK